MANFLNTSYFLWQGKNSYAYNIALQSLPDLSTSEIEYDTEYFSPTIEHTIIESERKMRTLSINCIYTVKNATPENVKQQLNYLFFDFTEDGTAQIPGLTLDNKGVLWFSTASKYYYKATFKSISNFALTNSGYWTFTVNWIIQPQAYVNVASDDHNNLELYQMWETARNIPQQDWLLLYSRFGITGNNKNLYPQLVIMTQKSILGLLGVAGYDTLQIRTFLTPLQTSMKILNQSQPNKMLGVRLDINVKKIYEILSTKYQYISNSDFVCCVYDYVMDSFALHTSNADTTNYNIGVTELQKIDNCINVSYGYKYTTTTVDPDPTSTTGLHGLEEVELPALYDVDLQGGYYYVLAKWIRNSTSTETAEYPVGNIQFRLTKGQLI